MLKLAQINEETLVILCCPALQRTLSISTQLSAITICSREVLSITNTTILKMIHGDSKSKERKAKKGKLVHSAAKQPLSDIFHSIFPCEDLIASSVRNELILNSTLLFCLSSPLALHFLSGIRPTCGL